MADRVLGPADSGHTMEVRQGERIIVELPENPTTGYRWELDDSGLGGVRLLDATNLAASAEHRMPGAASRRRLVFQASGPGEGRILLEKRRPWEEKGVGAARESFDVTVRIREP